MDYMSNLNSDASLVISNLSTDYILNIIDDTVNNNRSSIYGKAPNIIYVLETQYKVYLTNNPTMSEEEREKILADRANIYAVVLNKICSVFGLTIHADIQSMPVDELYSLVNVLYELFVSEYSFNITRFFVSYIMSNSEELHSLLDKSKLKSIPNTGASFAKTNYQNNVKIGDIASNLESLLYDIGGLDISISDIFVALRGPQLGSQLSVLVSSDTFFRDIYMREINNKPEYISDIILGLHRANS